MRMAHLMLTGWFGKLEDRIFHVNVGRNHSTLSTLSLAVCYSPQTSFAQATLKGRKPFHDASGAVLRVVSQGFEASSPDIEEKPRPRQSPTATGPVRITICVIAPTKGPHADGFSTVKREGIRR